MEDFRKDENHDLLGLVEQEYPSQDIDKIVLIVAVGRSASTTLQVILNTIPNSNICGENDAAVIHLLEFYHKIKNTHHYTQIEFKEVQDKKNISSIFQHRIKPAWFNTFNFPEIQEYIRQTILALYKKTPTTNVWGFKEIRWMGKLELLHLFRELFPQTRVILTIRENQVKQQQSGFFKDIPNSAEIIQKQTKEITDFYQRNRDFCFLHSLERLYNPGHMVRLFNFIGCGEHIDHEKIKKLLLFTRET